MKKWLIEWAIYIAAASIYSAWRYREDLKNLYVEFDNEFTEQLQWQNAVSSTLRSIRKLPETPERGGGS